MRVLFRNKILILNVSFLCKDLQPHPYPDVFLMVKGVESEKGL